MHVMRYAEEIRRELIGISDTILLDIDINE